MARRTNYSIDNIVSRYYNAINDLAEVQYAINVNDNEKKERFISSAGEALSQTLEWALRRHIASNNPSFFDSSDCDTPSMIIGNFHDGDEEGCLYNTTITTDAPTVDFCFLKGNKDLLTNNKKHRGDSLDYEVQKKYAIEISKFIIQYLDDSVILPSLEDFLKPETDKALDFYRSCNSFSQQDCIYIMLLDKRVLNSAVYEKLSRVNWSLVIDFYNGSLDNGFCKNAEPYYGIPFKIVNITDKPSDETFPIYNGEVPVIMANGMTGKSMMYQTFREWNKAYANKLNALIQQFFGGHDEQKVVVVSLLNDEDIVRHVFNCIDAYGRGLSFVIANNPDRTMNSLKKTYEGSIEYSEFTVEEVGNCIGNYLPKRSGQEQRGSFTLPGKDRSFHIRDIELPAYEENFELLYEGIDEGYSEKEEDFLKGSSSLTWEGAHRQFACKRTEFHRNYVAKIEKALTQGARRAMILHEPGFGGTTVARQIAYELHTKYPTLFLKQYKIDSIKTQLNQIYDSTKKPVLVFAEIPQALTNEEFDRLKAQMSESRPILLVGVKRGSSSRNPINLELTVSDWGQDICLLIDKYRPYLKRYTPFVQQQKEKIFEHLINETAEAYERTPFYVGLVTFEEEFYAIDSYLKKFVNAVSTNESQRKALIYLSICDYYDVKNSLPEGFFATVFGESDGDGKFRLDNRFNRTDGVVNSLLTYEQNQKVRRWRMRYPFFSHKLLPMLLNGVDSTESSQLMNQGSYCKQLIIDIANSSYSEILESTILQPLFIGTKAERAGESFTKVIADMNESDQEDVLVTLHTMFPENPHFCSHLARYYSKNKNDFGKAIEYADKALALSPDDDAMLYHIKAMCYSRMISNIANKYRYAKIKNTEYEKGQLEYVIEDLLPQASANFEKARRFQHDDEKEITYLPNIYMLITMFDYAIDVLNLDKKQILGEARSPYCDWIDEAQNLLEDLKRSYVADESDQYVECEAKLWDTIKDFTEVINLLNSQIDKGKNLNVVRRLLARTYFKRNDDYKNRLKPKVNSRILSLMEDNISLDPTDERNYVLWFNAARYSDMNLESVLSKLNQWKGLTPTRDVLFYCFVLNTIKAINNDSTAAGIAKNLLEQCRLKVGYDYITIKEWYVKSNLGIKRTYELSSDSEERVRVYGRIDTYKHPGDARILLDCGLEAFFKPSVKGITEAHLHHRASCFIGFSYDGIRAYDESVQLEAD